MYSGKAWKGRELHTRALDLDVRRSAVLKAVAA